MDGHRLQPAQDEPFALLLMGFEKEAALMKKLGKHTTGKGCLYIKNLADVDAKLLEELIVKGVKAMAKTRVK